MAKSSKNDEPILGDGVKTPEEKAELEKEVSPDATIPAEAQPDHDTEEKA